jgi:hypothetical protein
VPGIVKRARNANEWLDCVRFGAQNFNWTIKEFDTYTTAFAYGLLEQGLTPGDKLLLWLDSENSAELAVAQVAAMKSGLSVVNVDHTDEVEHIGDALEASGASVLLVSPHTRLDGNNQRANLLLDLVPELASAYPGERVLFSNFPNLKNIIHTGHVSIRGTTKFKESMLYTNKSLTNLRIPGPSEDALAMECYIKGDQVSSLTQSELVSKAEEIWKEYLNGDDKNLPVFLTLSLQYPLGFATFIGSLMNGRKVFIPSTYNVAKIAKNFHTQKSDVLICEDEVFQFDPPAHKVDEIRESVANFKKIIVAGSVSKTDSKVFSDANAISSNLYLQ